MIRNDARVTAERPRPDLAVARRRQGVSEKRLQARWAATFENFEANFGDAQTARITAELAAAPVAEPARSPVPEVGAFTAMRPQPAMAETYGLYQEAHAIANDSRRPVAVAVLQAEAQAKVREADQRAARARSNVALLPAASRGQFAESVTSAENLQASRRAELARLDDPRHPAVAAWRTWEDAHPGVDRVVSQTRALISAEVSAWMGTPGLGFLPDLPPETTAAERWQLYETNAAVLAYRETYHITAADALGPEPWAERQKAAYHDVCAALARVGVQIAGPEAAIEAPQFGRRPSLRAALAELGRQRG